MARLRRLTALGIAAVTLGIAISATTPASAKWGWGGYGGGWGGYGGLTRIIMAMVTLSLFAAPSMSCK